MGWSGQSRHGSFPVSQVWPAGRWWAAAGISAAAKPTVSPAAAFMSRDSFGVDDCFLDRDFVRLVEVSSGERDLVRSSFSQIAEGAFTGLGRGKMDAPFFHRFVVKGDDPKKL